MNFEKALTTMKYGGVVCREGWNGKGMFIFLVDGSQFKVNRAPLNVIFPEGTDIDYHGHIDMRTADGTIVPWLCSQTDMLAEDWEVASLPTVELASRNKGRRYTDEFMEYQRKGSTEMRPYVPGEDLSEVGVPMTVVPREGGMIARDFNDHADQWYVSPELFRENYINE